jgi:hypothetical protein
VNRELTDAEISEEVGFIKTVEMWPLYPVLPMKHRNRYQPGHPKDQGLGVMVAGQGPKVWLVDLFQLDTLGPETPALEFESYEALVAAGWMGD